MALKGRVTDRGRVNAQLIPERHLVFAYFNDTRFLNQLNFLISRKI